MSNEKLKPCPFCGVIPIQYHKGPLILCETKECAMSMRLTPYEEWNRRSCPDCERMREALEQIARGCCCGELVGGCTRKHMSMPRKSCPLVIAEAALSVPSVPEGGEEKR